MKHFIPKYLLIIERLLRTYRAVPSLVNISSCRWKQARVYRIDKVDLTSPVNPEILANELTC